MGLPWPTKMDGIRFGLADVAAPTRLSRPISAVDSAALTIFLLVWGMISVSTSCAGNGQILGDND